MKKSKVEDSVRDAFLERIKRPGCPSVGTIAEEMHLPKATLYSWIAAERQRARRGVSMKKKQAKRSPLAKLGLVAKSEGLGVDELNRFCEENGISFSELQSWRDLALSAMENSGNGDVISAKFHEQETAKLQAELNRKEKALAEAAALLVLQKKLRRSWEAEGPRIQEEGNPCRHRRGRRKWRKAFQGMRSDKALSPSLSPLEKVHGGQPRRIQGKKPGLERSRENGDRGAFHV